MKLLIIIPIILLSGCSLFRTTVPIKQKFPDAVPELTQKCPDLVTIEGDQAAITELLKTVVKNYQLYYECSLKNEGWNKWYEEQKRIFDKVK